MDPCQLVNEAERRLWDSFVTGEIVDLGPGDPAAEEFDPQSWDDDRIVRSEVIRGLLLGTHNSLAPGCISRVRLMGARIAGVLDLNGGEVQYELYLERCWLDEVPDLRFAKTQSVVIRGSRLPGLRAAGWQAAGGADLSENRIDGEVSLAGAKMGGGLSLSGASVTNKSGDALYARNLSVEEDLFCNCAALGAVKLDGAKIGGMAMFLGGTFFSPTGYALSARNLTVAHDMLCGDKFVATGGVALSSAKIGGNLTMMDALVARADENQDALDASDIAVDENVMCLQTFIAIGTVRLDDAKIGRAVAFEGVQLEVPEDADPSKHIALSFQSLNADQLRLPTNCPAVTDLRRATLRMLSLPRPALAAAMKLSGLTYIDLDPDTDAPVKHRLAWLRCDPDGYHPQPYEQLAAYYRANGQDQEARLVLLSKRRAHRKHGFRSSNLDQPWRRLRKIAAGVRCTFGLIVDGLAGYGYAPGRAFAWLLAAVVAGTWLLYPVAPSAPTSHRLINALLLATDSIIPTSPFGLRDAAVLTGNAYITALLLQGFGYAVSIAIVPAVTRAFGRADKY
jgi:hypothetical protein